LLGAIIFKQHSDFFFGFEIFYPLALMRSPLKEQGAGKRAHPNLIFSY